MLLSPTIPGGLTPGTYGGIARDLLTFVANFSPWTGALAAFALPGQETQGKTRGICNIAAILKMKDNPGSQTENETDAMFGAFARRKSAGKQ